MKAVICDFCGLAQPTDSKTSMAYDVSIFESDGFKAETEEEKLLTIDIRELCTPCATRVKDAVLNLQREIKAQALAIRQ